MNHLSDNQIETYLSRLEAGYVSEDNLEDSGSEPEDDPERFYESSEAIARDLQGSVEDEEEQDDDEPDPPLIEEEADHIEDDPPLVNELVSASTSSTKIRVNRNLIWRKRNLEIPSSNLEFTGNTEFSPEVMSLDSPYQYFTYFFTDFIQNKIVEESNMYSTQKQVSNPFLIGKIDIRKFIGILTYMSVIHYPSIRLYWSDKYGYASIKNAMTCKRFEKIKSIIHFNDNNKHLPQNHPQHDKLHKVRPIISHLNEKFATIPPPQRLAVDEQVCASKIHHYMKQYLPNKPHKWGFKLYVICSIYGFAHQFEVYCGEENKTILPGEPDLGVIGNTVVRLARIVPRRVNHIIYFDNYYTSLPLVSYLYKQGIYSLGTVQLNRLPKVKLPDKKKIMKKDIPRGFHEENTTTYDNVEVSATIWKDNKPVTLLSTYVGALPVTTVQRYDKKQKKRVDIDCPKVITEYNANMGGVDLMDSFIGRYRIRIKSRKWTMRLFYHMLDMTIINAWILSRNINALKGQKSLRLAEFRLALADTLCELDDTGNSSGASSPTTKRGRPSSASIEKAIQEVKRKRVPGQTAPGKDVRLDKVAHWPVWSDRGRCKYPFCKGYTQTICIKCGVFLCFNKKNNCFHKYHITN
ncbi:piggyBac transposable element-derived protein 4-like isoform X1 [Pectinophora gossypiella]|uniref:piggyBac transposable element-derived protein 4-like isoform X1 n=1 Tax=Pectinophora gossypiella TaxID=13191 RepID=UPI00214F080B|nr:piggyBac transposable element-derived protein 4-like isoform X1 [Pectinophora gossypiella]